MKSTRKEIIQTAKWNGYTEITAANERAIYELEKHFNDLAYSVGTYGVNCRMLVGRTTGTIYLKDGQSRWSLF